MAQDVQDGTAHDARRDRALAGLVGLVALAGSLSGLQTYGIVTEDAAIVLAGILVLAAVMLSTTWRSAVVAARGRFGGDARTDAAQDPARPASKAPGGEADAAIVVRALSRGLARLGSGDPAARIDVALPGAYEALRIDFNAAAERIGALTPAPRERAAIVPRPEPAERADRASVARRAVPAAAARPGSSRKAAKVDLFAGRMSEFVALRDAGDASRRSAAG